MIELRDIFICVQQGFLPNVITIIVIFNTKIIL